MTLAVSETSFKQEVLECADPVLVNFWAPWCGLCNLVNPLLSQLQSDLANQVKLVSVNADQNLRIASQQQLTSLPTVILFHQGKVLSRLEGFKSRDELRASIASLKKTIEQVAYSPLR